MMSTQAINETCCMIGPEFIWPDAQEIIVDTYSIGTFVITDTNHQILIKVKPCTSTFHRQRVILDPNDNPIMILREKNMSVHDRWNVFRGESKSDSDLIFSVKTEHMIQLKTSVKVLLANSKHDSCDFMFKGSWSKKKCTLYIGNSSTTIAQMHKPSENNKKYCNKERFMVTINPNVDYAFVVAIIAIIDAMKNPDEIRAVTAVTATANVIGSTISFL